MAAVGPGGGGPGPRPFAPLRMLKELEDSMEPASLILAELLVVLCAWLTGGVIFFYFSEKYDDNKFGEVTGSTLWYTIYFCTNIGLGVGSAPMKPSIWYERLFACAFCLCGNCLIVGGVGVYYGIQSQQVLKRLAYGDNLEEEHIRRVQLFVRGCGFVGVLLVGMVIGHWTAKYDKFIDLLTFSTTNLTTSGLLVGKEWNANFAAQAVFMLLGIPYSITFFSECSSYMWHVAAKHTRKRSRRRQAQTTTEASSIAAAAAAPSAPPRHVEVPTSLLEQLEDIAVVAGFVAVDAERPSADAGGAPSSPRRLRKMNSMEARRMAQAAAAADGDDAPRSTGVAALDYVLDQRDRGDPLRVALTDLFVLTAAWLVFGILVFYYGQADWSLVYSFYYAVNVGFGVGSAPKQATRDLCKLYTCWHCVTGSILVVGGIGIVFKEQTKRIRDTIARSDAPPPSDKAASKGESSDSEPESASDGEGGAEAESEMFHVLGAFYGVAVLAGMGVARRCGFTTFTTMVEWAVTNMTTAGLLVSHRSGTATTNVYFASGLFLLLAIPTGAVFIGELASLLFVRRERAVVEKRRRESMVASAGGAPPANAASKPKPARRSSTTVPADYLAYLQDAAKRAGRPVDLKATTPPVDKAGVV